MAPLQRISQVEAPEWPQRAPRRSSRPSCDTKLHQIRSPYSALPTQPISHSTMERKSNTGPRSTRPCDSTLATQSWPIRGRQSARLSISTTSRFRKQLFFDFRIFPPHGIRSMQTNASTASTWPAYVRQQPFPLWEYCQNPEPALVEPAGAHKNAIEA